MMFFHKVWSELVTQLQPFLGALFSVFRAKAAPPAPPGPGAKVISILPYLARERGEVTPNTSPVIIEFKRAPKPKRVRVERR